MADPSSIKNELLDLPVELLYEIASNVDDQSIVKFCQVSKETNEICKDKVFWLRKVHKQFPELSDDEIDFWFQNGPYVDPSAYKNYVRLVTNNGGITYGSENYYTMKALYKRLGKIEDIDLIKYFITSLPL